MPAEEPITLNCPTCKKTIQWSEEYPHRPFCSKRCQQVDFGDWALEKHSIPGEPAFDMRDQEDPERDN